MNSKLKTKRASIWLACLTAFALVAAACGDDEEPAAPAAAPAVDTAALEQAQADAAAAAAAAADVQAEAAAAAEAAAEAQAALEAALAEAEGAVDPEVVAQLERELEAAQAEAEAASAAAAAAAEAAAAAAAAATAEPMDEVNMTPGAGVGVTMARANWSTGYMQAAIYRYLLQELGYDVSDPSDLELAPSNAYLAMAQGEFDFWANSWYPNHDSFVAGDMPDGTAVSDHVTVVGEEMIGGALEGFLTNKSLVDEHGITSLEQIATDPDLFAIYDSTDSSPNDGVIQVLGCIEGWGCKVVIDEMIATTGFALEQLEVGGYDAVITEAVARVEDGTPFIAYTWTPSGYVTQLIPGGNSMWLSLVDASLDGGELTRSFDVGTHAGLGADSCTSVPCILLIAADVQVTANNGFLEANPAAAKLLELVKISPLDVALQSVRYGGGENSTFDVNRHATEWIAVNRALVDGWLAEARAAA